MNMIFIPRYCDSKDLGWPFNLLICHCQQLMELVSAQLTKAQETTSTLSSPLSLSEGPQKNRRPSLADRYPTSPSGSSEGSKSDQSSELDLNLIEDNLDIISIITDGMN